MRHRPVEVEGSPAPDPGSERRGAARSPRNLRAFWRPLAARGEVLGPAAVCNLSQLGVALQAAAPQRLGAILVIRLEGPTERLSAPRLAHVRHVTEQPDGGWLLGCAFATPLTENDLAELARGADPTDDGAPGGAPSPDAGGGEAGAAWMAGSGWERRSGPRREVPLVRVVLWEPRTGARSNGWVADLSDGGLGLLGLRPFATGTALRVRPHAADTLPWLEVVVRRCRRQGPRWFVGCQFAGTPHPLTLELLG
jgi:hypothetical protein